MAAMLRYLSEIYNNRPGSQTIHAFNRSLLKAGIPEVCHHSNTYITNIARHFDDRGWGRNFIQLSNRAYLVAMMWPKTARLLPVGYWAELVPICFDCWPKDYQKWEHIFHRYRVKTAFFTARQSADFFRQKMVAMDCLWLPEAADLHEYKADIPLVDRTIDVLELGRRFESYHAAIVSPLQEKGYQHMYVQGKKRLFSSREQLMDAWQQTKISICFPKSLTNYEGSGGVETVTFRYFESIASKSLIVGHCPQELWDVFGYNPVIEIGDGDYAGKLLTLLSDIANYQDLVDKNYQRMFEVGTWDARVQTMLPLLKQRGYVVEAA